MFFSIQYLRGISALAVVFFHIYGTTGQQGVAIFFVISGFLMMDIMDKKAKSNSINTAFNFFKARFLRIAPLYYVLTALTLMLGLAYDPTYFRIAQSLSFLALGSVLPVGYTLTYEFLFYSVCTVSIILVRSHLHRAFGIVLILISADYVLNALLINKGYEYGNYFYLFIVGVFTYFIYERFNGNNQYSLSIVLLNVVIILISFLYLFFSVYLDVNWDTDGVNQYAINNSIPSFFIVYCCLVLEREYKKCNIRPRKFLPALHHSFLYLGAASYSIYLTHYITLHGIEKFINYPLSNELLLLISISIGCISYQFLEIPLARLIKSYTRREDTFARPNKI